MRHLRISVADDEVVVRDYFQKMLPRIGHEVVSVAENGRELVEHCRMHAPDLVITDIDMPEMDGIDAAIHIYAERTVPVILVTAHHDHEFIERAEADHIMAYLIKPVSKVDLESAIWIAYRRFEQFQAVRQEASDLRKALADRKIIEKAKGVIMKTANLDEPSAFQRLQHLARDKNKKMVDIAQSVLLADDVTR